MNFFRQSECQNLNFKYDIIETLILSLNEVKVGFKAEEE